MMEILGALATVAGIATLALVFIFGLMAGIDALDRYDEKKREK